MRVQGKRGRPRQRWFDTVNDDMRRWGLVKDYTENRARWHSLIELGALRIQQEEVQSLDEGSFRYTEIMTSQEVFTQTDNEVHDVFYYKTRAYKAERALLTLRRDQYIHSLTMKLKDLEKDTSNKLHLYSYSPDKMRQLQLDFQNHTILTEQLQRKAQEIFLFNLQALGDGHELNDLPLIEDKEVDLDTYRLGPVTPTIPNNPRGTHPLLMPHLSRDSSSFSHNMFGPGDGSMMNGDMSRFPPATPGAYIFPRNNSQEHPSAQGFPTQSTTASNIFNMPPLTAQAGPIGSNRPTPTPPTAQFNDLDMQRTRSEEILRMISIDSPHNNLDMPESALNHHHQSSIYSHHNQQNMMGQTSTTKPPDVIPRGAPPANNSPPSSQPGSSLTDHSISGPMGLDSIDFDNPNHPKKPQKWSQIAAVGTEADDWQAVIGKKAPRMPVNKLQPLSMNRQTHGPAPEFGANFEQMVEAVQEKYQLTRPEVIAVLQVVRNERLGDMNISLTDLMKDAERLLTKKGNVLKPASLTARARAVPEHDEPCDNQLCPARLKLLKYRTELCLSYQTTGRCHMKPGSCVYAHGAGEQRPLPKEELCERYLEGKCNNRRCVYAHGASELKNRPVVNTVEYLKSKVKKPAQDNSKLSEDLTLNDGDHDPRGDECSICLEKMSRKSRKKLDCGHDAFHYKCLKKWVAGEGDRSCPLCRSNTLLPEEYPRLGA